MSESRVCGLGAESDKSVLMAMSGGVDSSVAALLLVRSGYRVIGSTMHLFGNEVLLDGAESTCCSLDDVEDAKSVCRKIGIEHYTFNFGDRFKNSVIDKFCKSYIEGSTPNPCIDCNRYLKFSALQQRRRELDLDYVATGHYVRRIYDADAGRWRLFKAKDASKDQSYVLFHITQDQLAHMLFPLGDLTKNEVRELASAGGFVNADKDESQDICFIPDGDYVSFIESYVCGDLGLDEATSCGQLSEERPEAFLSGDIVDRDGNVLGRHSGLVNYTIGQRKGIGVASSEPLYVFAKDVADNRLVVGHSSEILIREVIADDINLIALDSIEGEIDVQVKTHYRQTPVSAKVTQSGDEFHAKFYQPIKACSPGQALVLYDGDEVIGGGTITSCR